MNNIPLCICIKGSGTYPCTLLSKRLLTVEKHQEKHKCISKDGVFCCGYSGDRLGRFFRWASSLFLNIFTEEAVTTSAGRSFHILTTLWLKVNLHRSSLDRSFRSFSECPRRLEVSAIWRSPATQCLPVSHGEFYRPISCLPCPSYKTMNQD